MFSPWRGALRPQSWGLCAWNPASSFVPARPCGSPSHPGVWKLWLRQARMVGGGPFLLGWTVHMLIARTQRHIFIIVIKLYCYKRALSVSLGNSRVGWGLRTEGGAGEDREIGGLTFGVGRGAFGQDPRPADSATITLGQQTGCKSHPEIPRQGQPEWGQGQASLPFPEPQLLLGFWPPGKSSKRERLISCTGSEVTLPAPFCG